MNDKSHRRTVGQTPFIFHRMDLPYYRRKADRTAAASLVAGVCAIALGVILIIAMLSTLFGGGL